MYWASGVFLKVEPNSKSVGINQTPSPLHFKSLVSCCFVLVHSLVLISDVRCLKWKSERIALLLAVSPWNEQGWRQLQSNRKQRTRSIPTQHFSLNSHNAGMWVSRAGLSIFGAVISKDTGLGNMESIVRHQLFSILCSHGYLSRGFCLNEAQASRGYWHACHEGIAG